MESLPLTVPAESARGTECYCALPRIFFVRPRENERTRDKARSCCNAADADHRQPDGSDGRKSVRVRV